MSGVKTTFASAQVAEDLRRQAKVICGTLYDIEEEADEAEGKHGPQAWQVMAHSAARTALSLASQLAFVRDELERMEKGATK